jgi:Tfp pilus assembly protein PilF
MQRNRENAYVHALLGNIYYREDKFEDARTSFERAIQLDDARASYQNNLGVVLRDLDRESAAEQAFRDALRADRRYPAANYNLAVTLAAGPNRDVREARKYYDRALRYGYPPDPTLEVLLD